MKNEPADSLSLCLLSPDTLSWEAEAVTGRGGESFQVVTPEHASQIFLLDHGDSQTVLHAGSLMDHAAVGRAVRQTWDWPSAQEAVSGCSFSYLVSDRRAKHLSRKERLTRLHRAVAALLATCLPGSCAALHSPSCQRLVAPEAFVEAGRPGGDFLCGAVNVRLYEVEGHGPGTRLMETLGLSALGLPDLQCVFRGLDPNGVAALFWDYAYYLFEKGDVISDGDVIRALKEGEHWTCGRQWALTEPRRVVLDLYPGPGHDPAIMRG
jgi:Domain of unknown function (DUF4261)